MNPIAPRRTRRDGTPYPRWDPRGWRWGSWWRGHNCLEYQIWFRSVVAHQATRGFLTFGGNSIFIRRDLLARVGGWPEMLTEDAALGMRMSTLLQELGLRIYTVYLPNLVTREQTPLSLCKWTVQRIRWLQGFMEVKQMGDWRRLPTLRQRLLAWETLSMPALQAAFGITVPVALATGVYFKAPVLVVMWTYVPTVLMLLYASVLWTVFKDYCRAFDIRVSVLYMVRLVLMLPVYQLMVSIAAIGAKIRQLQGKTNWVVTEKSGEHFTTDVEQGDEVLVGAH
jgi:cellulose synthase/poly-beta-1,6-N-acetylglucosamine synthase-like glycosyltransferase